jgi:co-chaperonin GroES (HSP10)
MIARSTKALLVTRPAYSPGRVSKLRALHDWILITDMEFSERITQSGLILPNDNGTGSGIRPRWGRVYAVGPRQELVSVGQWICVAHGRWTRGVDIQDDQGHQTLRRIDPRDILLVSDTRPQDDTMSDAINVPARTN